MFHSDADDLAVQTPGCVARRVRRPGRSPRVGHRYRRPGDQPARRAHPHRRAHPAPPSRPTPRTATWHSTRAPSPTNHASKPRIEEAVQGSSSWRPAECQTDDPHTVSQNRRRVSTKRSWVGAGSSRSWVGALAVATTSGGEVLWPGRGATDGHHSRGSWAGAASWDHGPRHTRKRRQAKRYGTVRWVGRTRRWGARGRDVTRSSHPLCKSTGQRHDRFLDTGRSGPYVRLRAIARLLHWSPGPPRPARLRAWTARRAPRRNRVCSRRGLVACWSAGRHDRAP